MKFGTKYSDVKDEVVESGGGDYLRTFKEGDTHVLIANGPDEWIAYWEHSQYPVGYPFPCTEEADCPGCNSDKESVSKRGRKFIIPALTFTTNRKGEEIEYANLYKVPRALADKLALRYERRKTLSDRTYLITRIKTGPNAYDVEYDVEAGDPINKDLSTVDFPDGQAILVEMYENRDQKSGSKKEDKPAPGEGRTTFGKRPEGSGRTAEPEPEAEPVKEEPAPFDHGGDETEEEYVEREYSWDDLTKMSPDDLLAVIQYEQKWGKLPAEENVKSLDKQGLLDWLSINA